MGEVPPVTLKNMSADTAAGIVPSTACVAKALISHLLPTSHCARDEFYVCTHPQIHRQGENTEHFQRSRNLPHVALPINTQLPKITVFLTSTTK